MVAATVRFVLLLAAVCGGWAENWYDDLVSHLRVPSNFNITVFAEVPSVRSLALSPSGTVYATHGRGNPGRVYACRDHDGDGLAVSQGECWPVTNEYTQPNGLAFLEGNLCAPRRSRLALPI